MKQLPTLNFTSIPSHMLLGGISILLGFLIAQNPNTSIGAFAAEHFEWRNSTVSLVMAIVLMGAGFFALNVPDLRYFIFAASPLFIFLVATTVTAPAYGPVGGSVVSGFLLLYIVQNLQSEGIRQSTTTMLKASQERVHELETQLAKLEPEPVKAPKSNE